MKSFIKYVSNLNEANFKPGNLKLKSGETVKISREDAKALATMLKGVDVKNRKKMEDDILKNKKEFEEVLKFAREAV